MSIFSRKKEAVVESPAAAAPPNAKPGYGVVTFTLPWSAVEAKLASAAAKISEQRPLAGFRAGHVPVDVARQRYGDEALMAEAYDAALSPAYAAEVAKANLATIGQPQMEFAPLPAWGVDVIVTATVPVVPPVTVPDWTKVQVAPVTKELKPGEVDEVIQHLRERFASEAAVDRPAAAGDLVELDYGIQVEGVLVEGGSGKGHKAIIGRQHLLPEVEAMVLGMKAGETKVEAVPFAPTHSFKAVAGKAAQCTITLAQVFERTLPALDDEFAGRLGPFKTLDELRQRLTNDLTAEAQAEAARQTERQALEAAVKAATFGPFPDLLINDEVQRLFHEFEHSLQGHGTKLEDYLLHIKKTKQDILLDFVEPALQRLKVTLLLRAVAREQHLHPTDEEVAAEAKVIAGRVADPQRVDDPQVRAHILADLTQRAAVAWVMQTIVKS